MVKGASTARVGVSFGTALGGISGAESEHQHFLKKGQRAVNQTLALQVFGGSAHSNIAIECGFRGPGTTNSNSCASGVIAVGEALRYIPRRHGRRDDRRRRRGPAQSASRSERSTSFAR
jgi:3-oxoacyl-[acyl-carrier-protein] synthase II